MQLGGNLADLLVQEAVDHRLDIFVRRRGDFARFETAAYGIEPRLDRLALFEREDVGAPEGNRPGFREPYFE